MREHEVPTHLQAEDKVLLWFTFPQLVAITAVAALAYGAYRYIPVGSSEVRIVLAVILGLAGMAMIVGKVGGRRLPLVAADLLRYRLGARRYAGPPTELVRPEAPAPVQAAPSPLALMAKNARRIMRRRNGRMPFRPHGWFGKGRRRRGKGKDPKQDKKKTKRSKDWRNLLAVLAVAATAAAGAVAPAVQADGHHPDGLGFEITEPVPGRRIYVESLQVSGDSAEVTLRAAAAIDLQVRAYGGPGGRISVFRGTARLRGGEDEDLHLPTIRRLALPDPLLAGRAGAGGCPQPEGRPGPVPVALRRGRAVRPEARIPRLDARATWTESSSPAARTPSRSSLTLRRCPGTRP